MTRKESGWVSEALRLADEYAGAEYLSEAGAAYVRLRDFIDAKDASITSLQSAAEGLEEALQMMRHEAWCAGHRRDTEFGWPEAFRKTDAALAAFQAIKEK